MEEAKMAHSVAFDDTDGNWLAWGRLVDDWIDHPANRPHDIGGLEAQMTKEHITGIQLAGHPVPNPNPNRPVNINTYNNAPPGPIVIPVPTQAMRDADRRKLIGPSTYPLHSFYTTIFGNAPTRAFNTAGLVEMAQCRLGEYVINECM
jgi:hypothetical protein